MIKKVEVLANIAVTVTSVILCSVLVKKHFFSTVKPEAAIQQVQSNSPASGTSRRQSIQAGTKISLPGIDWSRNTRTIVLALSTTCHFCSESGPLYQKIEEQKPSNVGLIAVLPQPLEDSRSYLNKLGVKTPNVVQGSLSSIGVSGTPTLLLVDNNGSVVASWVGKLEDAEAARVMEQLHQ